MLSDKSKKAAKIVSDHMALSPRDARLGAAYALAQYLRGEGEIVNSDEFYSECNCSLIGKSAR